MTTSTTIDVSALEPLSHAEAMGLQAVELDQTLDLLRALGPNDWATKTACPDWDVRQMYLHVLGACEASASMKENMHQMRAAKKHRKVSGGPLEAGLSNVQVRERLDLSPAQLLDRLTEVAPVTVRKRTKTPGLMRRMKLKIDGPVVEKWALGYLIDTIYLRDLWMHRIDTTQVTDHDMVLTAEHDGRIVTDVVAEWARRHGRPFNLTLTGQAGGEYTFAGAGADASITSETIELDAVAFCLELAGRSDGEGLMSTIVPF
jgi:uncharacterized protein (TIGR03083 family)